MTPFSLLLEYHNLGRPFDSYEKAQLLIGTCMDFRINFRIPPKFAYVMRSGGANFRFNEFHISYTVAVAGIKYFALIGHTHCGMGNLSENRTDIVNGLQNAGWERKAAEKHFEESFPLFETGDEKTFILNEVKRLSEKYPRVVIAPFMYDVETQQIRFLQS